MDIRPLWGCIKHDQSRSKSKANPTRTQLLCVQSQKRRKKQDPISKRQFPDKTPSNPCTPSQGENKNNLLHNNIDKTRSIYEIWVLHEMIVVAFWMLIHRMLHENDTKGGKENTYGLLEVEKHVERLNIKQI